MQQPARLKPAPRRRGRWGWLWLLLLGALGYGGYRYYQDGVRKRQAADAAQAQRAAHRAVVVSAVPAHRGDLPIYLRGLGTVEAFNTVNIRTRVDGPIVSVNFREGQHVNQGDLLAEIDPRPFQVALQQAQGTACARPGAA